MSKGMNRPRYFDLDISVLKYITYQRLEDNVCIERNAFVDRAPVVRGRPCPGCVDDFRYISMFWFIRKSKLAALGALLILSLGCERFTTAEVGQGGYGGELQPSSGGSGGEGSGVPEPGTGGAESATGGSGCSGLRTVQEYQADYSEDKADEAVTVLCPDSGSWCAGFPDGLHLWSCVAVTDACEYQEVCP